MQMMVRLRAARCVAWLLASAIVVSYAGAPALASQLGGGTTQTVVMFPLERPTGVAASPQIVGDLNGFVKDALSAHPRYRVLAYSERLPVVQRLVATQPDKRAATGGPFATDSAAMERAVMLSNGMSADLALVGSMTKYAFDSEKGTVELAVRVTLLDAKTGKAVLPSREYIGTASKPADVVIPVERVLASQAVMDAGKQIVTSVTGQEYRPLIVVQQDSVNQKDKKKSWLPMLLLSLGVGLLLGGSGSNGNGSTAPAGDDVPPPPPPGW